MVWEMVRKWSQNGQKMVQKWSENSPKMLQLEIDGLRNGFWMTLPTLDGPTHRLWMALQSSIDRQMVPG